MSLLTKEEVVQAVITQMKAYDEDILVETKLLENYKAPDKIAWKSTGVGFFPDLKITISAEKIMLYEVELSNKINIEKWRLFSLTARKENGDFTVVVPESMIGRVETIIAEKNFKNIKLMFVPN
ncbi:hypothetical protein OU798_20440 [Prolixibacteraceae bacterium Z1-6]|uniref:Uncharacterized protein n=1 Tax=Draconibacterium aestuarii TaxID=2998507 RepID=A0A9X3J9F6_9BACT|nr:hypothetical protein [Prolixibacteraceae bacterium Z1-6]